MSANEVETLAMLVALVKEGFDPNSRGTEADFIEWKERVDSVVSEADRLLATRAPGRFSELLAKAQSRGAYAVEWRVVFDDTIEPTKLWRVTIRDRRWNGMNQAESQSGEGALRSAVEGLP